MNINVYLLHNPMCDYKNGRNGHYNGYVVIPKGHPWYGKTYDQIHEMHPDLRVHGGLTYSGHTRYHLDSTDSATRQHLAGLDAWSVGFDTSHAGDTPQKWGYGDVMDEAIKLAYYAECVANGATNRPTHTYRRKPFTVQAWQVPEGATDDMLPDFLDRSTTRVLYVDGHEETKWLGVKLKVENGWCCAYAGDWIVRMPDGDFTKLSHMQFQLMFEEVG